jgi:hypothetical protein
MGCFYWKFLFYITYNFIIVLFMPSIIDVNINTINAYLLSKGRKKEPFYS